MFSGCYAPPKIAHGGLTSEFTYQPYVGNTTVKYECDVGYELNGNENAMCAIVAGSYPVVYNWTAVPECKRIVRKLE